MKTAISFVILAVLVTYANGRGLKLNGFYDASGTGLDGGAYTASKGNAKGKGNLGGGSIAGNSSPGDVLAISGVGGNANTRSFNDGDASAVTVGSTGASGQTAGSYVDTGAGVGTASGTTTLPGGFGYSNGNSNAGGAAGVLSGSSGTVAGSKSNAGTYGVDGVAGGTTTGGESASTANNLFGGKAGSKTQTAGDTQIVAPYDGSSAYAGGNSKIDAEAAADPTGTGSNTFGYTGSESSSQKSGTAGSKTQIAGMGASSL